MSRRARWPGGRLGLAGLVVLAGLGCADAPPRPAVARAEARSGDEPALGDPRPGERAALGDPRPGERAALGDPRSGERAALGDPLAGERLALGVGDRISSRTAEGWNFEPAVAARHGIPLDLFAMWLPRGWSESWVGRRNLARLVVRGTTPVLIHYYFGDAISRERLAAQREDWLASIERLAELAQMDAPVLVVLEPEFNTAPPAGEGSVLDGPEFGAALGEATRRLRARAPNVLVGTCPGHFPGSPGLETALGDVAANLDFLAFQEMRAHGDPDGGVAGYLDVAGAAVDYARQLQRSFGRPLLWAYVAVSSHGGWEARQAGALRGVVARRHELEEAGVFGLLYFQLRDDPEHQGYFGAAEPHFGLLRADGSPKPALAAFRELVWAVRGRPAASD